VAVVIGFEVLGGDRDFKIKKCSYALQPLR